MTLTKRPGIVRKAKMKTFNASWRPFEVSFHTSNMEMREELERTMNHYLNIAIKEELKRKEIEAIREERRAMFAKTVRQLVRNHESSLIYKFFIDDILVNVYATNHVHERIQQRKVDMKAIKHSLIECEYHMQGTLIDRPSGHEFVIKNNKLDMSVAGAVYEDGGSVKIVLTTTLHHSGFYEKEGVEPIVIN